MNLTIAHLRHPAVLALVASFCGMSFVHAAPLTWIVFNIEDDTSQISTEGTLVEARIGILAPDAGVTVNGVTFDDVGTLDDPTHQDNITQRAGIFTDPSYKALLQFPSRSNNPGDQTITLENLTVGHLYQVQIWFQDADSSNNPGGVGVVLSNGSGAPNPSTLGHVTLLPQAEGRNYGQYALGEFMADDTKQVITLRRWQNLKSHPTASVPVGISAWQLRDLSATSDP